MSAVRYSLVLLGLLGPGTGWAACVGVELPRGEAPGPWRGPLVVAGLCLGPTEGASIRMERVGARWRIRVRNEAGEVREAMVAPPTTADAREDVGHLASSLLHAGPVVAIEATAVAPPVVEPLEEPRPLPPPITVVPVPKVPRVASVVMPDDLDGEAPVVSPGPRWGWWATVAPQVGLRQRSAASGGLRFGAGVRALGWLRLGLTGVVASAHAQDETHSFTNQRIGGGLWAAPSLRVSPIVGLQFYGASRVFSEDGERTAAGWMGVLSVEAGVGFWLAERVRLEPMGTVEWDVSPTELRLSDVATAVLPRLSLGFHLALVVGDPAI